MTGCSFSPKTKYYQKMSEFYSTSITCYLLYFVFRIIVFLTVYKLNKTENQQNYPVSHILFTILLFFPPSILIIVYLVYFFHNNSSLFKFSSCLILNIKHHTIIINLIGFANLPNENNTFIHILK